MKLPTRIVLLSLCCVLACGIGLEIRDLPRTVQAPPGVRVTTFEELSGFELPSDPRYGPGDVLKRVPSSILALDARKVLLQGFMMPTQLGGDRKVRAFILARSQASCCFGLPLRICDVVAVRMAGPSTPLLMDQVISVTGNFHVQEQWEGNFLGSIYQLDAESAVPAFAAAP